MFGLNKAQSRLKASEIRGRNKNISTIEPLSQGIRSQSPHLYNPMIQIKYETNNYYQPMPHSPNYNDMNTTQHLGRSPKASNVVIDGSIFKNNNTGFMSPQPGGPRAFDFHPPKIGRVNSPMNMTINNTQQKTSAVRKPKKSISFKSKGDQDKVSALPSPGLLKFMISLWIT